MTRTIFGLLFAALLASCARFGAPTSSEPPTPTASSAPVAVPVEEPSATARSTAQPGELPGSEEIRAALLGPSPVPSEWAAIVHDIVATLEEAVGDLPSVAGMPPEEAACETWKPLVGRLHWVGGAVVERQVAIAHLAQLVAVAPDPIRPAAEDALRIASRAAAEQLQPGGDMEVVGTVPREELRTIGTWALERCDLQAVAEPDPDTEGWTEEDHDYSCGLDRSALERGMEQFRAGPGNGRYPTHPHEIELSVEYFVYPSWHRLATVNNDVEPPTFEVEPIPGSHCDR